jgi:ABC-type nickel/cobalt efflux system permease component RcnA
VKVRNRVLAVAGLVITMFGFAGVGGASSASAHPLGNFTINRYSGIVLSPGRIEVDYVLDMAEIPTFQVQPDVDVNGDRTVDALERQGWADRAAPAVLSNLSVTVGASPVALKVESDRMRFREGQAGLPILYFTATFGGSLPSTDGRVTYADGNYPGRIWWKEITVRSLQDVSVIGSSVPTSSISGELLSYPQDLLSSPLDVTSVMFSFRPGPATGPVQTASHGPTVSGAPVAGGGAFAGLIRWRLTPLVLFVSLLLALAFGAIHALGPGHGKTITAAYLVGSGAKVGQAVAVGAAVALIHTASVLTLGLVLFVLARSFPAEQVYPWLTLATGLVALGLGAGLFVSRLRARRRGLDPSHGHTHPWDEPFDAHTPHPHTHELEHDAHIEAPRLRGGGVAVLDRIDLDVHVHEDHSPRLVVAPSRPLSGRGLMALAVAGGILPSPTAFVVLTGAISAHRVGYGLALISAFSLGLAGALIGIGLLALRARSVVAARLRGRWARLIPLGSALVIVGFGLFFAARGLTQLG